MKNSYDKRFEYSRLDFCIKSFTCSFSHYFLSYFAFSRSSSIKSKYFLQHSLFMFEYSICLFKVGSLTSIGIMESVPYVRLNGVSLVVVCGVHLYAYIISGNFSTHSPFAFPSLLFRWPRMNLLADSACPFVCGCSTKVVIDLTPKST